VLSGDTRQQKLFGLIGAKRGGKGTIARVLTALVGEGNVAGPTIASLSERFGLAPLLGRPLAIISDARLESKNLTLVERLLAISGEDRISVDRKYVPAQQVRLPTRFVLISNETPRFTDTSGALASRFVILHITKSFYGHEDLTLTETLLGELPGIFNWALTGLERLNRRGHFIVPKSSESLLRELEELSSPIAAFVRDCCHLGPGFKVECGNLHRAYQSWCLREGIDDVAGPGEFGRKLHSAVPDLKAPTQVRREGDRIRQYEGIGLISVFDL
jgi:putative DNA primase/helicase